MTPIHLPPDTPAEDSRIADGVGKALSRKRHILRSVSEAPKSEVWFSLPYNSPLFPSRRSRCVRLHQLLKRRLFLVFRKVPPGQHFVEFLDAGAQMSDRFPAFAISLIVSGVVSNQIAEQSADT